MASTHETPTADNEGRQYYRVPRLKTYALAALAGIWLADGIALLIAPRLIIEQLQEILRQSPSIVRWELLSILGGLFLVFAGQNLHYHWLWMVTAGGMIFKGTFLLIAPTLWRSPIITWCVNRDDVDYRFYGLGLCALAVLLLHALGWIGQS